MRYFSRMMGLILLLNFIASCDDKKLEDRRISPMNYDEWQVKEFPYSGLKIDLPKNEIHISESAKGKASLLISFHAISPPPGVLDDAKILVTIQIEKIPLERLAERKADYLESGNYKEDAEYTHVFMSWYDEFHPDTSSHEKGNYTYYRRDVKINDKEIFHAHVAVINAKVPGIEEDHKAVKRILDSIVPIGDKK